MTYYVYKATHYTPFTTHTIVCKMVLISQVEVQGKKVWNSHQLRNNLQLPSEYVTHLIQKEKHVDKG